VRSEYSLDSRPEAEVLPLTWDLGMSLLTRAASARCKELSDDSDVRLADAVDILSGHRDVPAPGSQGIAQ
jgi:hypothetical protein